MSNYNDNSAIINYTLSGLINLNVNTINDLPVAAPITVNPSGSYPLAFNNTTGILSQAPIGQSLETSSTPSFVGLNVSSGNITKSGASDLTISANANVLISSPNNNVYLQAQAGQIIIQNTAAGWNGGLLLTNVDGNIQGYQQLNLAGQNGFTFIGKINNKGYISIQADSSSTTANLNFYMNDNVLMALLRADAQYFYFYNLASSLGTKYLTVGNLFFNINYDNSQLNNYILFQNNSTNIAQLDTTNGLTMYNNLSICSNALTDLNLKTTSSAYKINFNSATSNIGFIDSTGLTINYPYYVTSANFTNPKLTNLSILAYPNTPIIIDTSNIIYLKNASTTMATISSSGVAISTNMSVSGTLTATTFSPSSITTSTLTVNGNISQTTGQTTLIKVKCNDIQTSGSPTMELKTGTMTPATRLTLEDGGSTFSNRLMCSAGWTIANDSYVNYTTQIKFTTAAGNTYYNLGIDAGYNFAITSTQTGNKIYLTPTSTANWVTYSDRRLKRDIRPIKPCLDLINQLKPSHYKWIAESDDIKESTGLIAQDLLEIIPELVDNSGDMLGISTTDGMIPYLIKSIQELSTQVNILTEILKRNNLI